MTNGNNWIKYIIQTLVVLILVGLGSWNLIVTVELNKEVALLQQAWVNHMEIEKQREGSQFEELDEHSERLNYLEDTHYTAEDARKVAELEVVKMKRWCDARYERK